MSKLLADDRGTADIAALLPLKWFSIPQCWPLACISVSSPGKTEAFRDMPARQKARALPVPQPEVVRICMYLLYRDETLTYSRQLNHL